MSEIGFLSIVDDRSDRDGDTVLVRSRWVKDLEAFRRCLPPQDRDSPITEDELRDYRFRLCCSKVAAARAVASLVSRIDYPNFKDRVAETDPDRASVYSRIWRALLEFADRWSYL